MFLLFEVIAREHVGTQGMLAREHARNAGTWARKHARHVGMWARKHARHVGTWACKAHNSADSSILNFGTKIAQKRVFLLKKKNKKVISPLNFPYSN